MTHPLMHHKPRITTTAHNLRSPDWLQVDERALLRRIKRQADKGIEWKVVPWQRNISGVMRSYVALCEDGAIYAVFMRRSDTA